jgi:cytochrome b-561 domain containing protein 2
MWMVGQIILGAGSVWFRGQLFGGGMKAKALWKYHRASGYLLFPLLLFTVHLGGTWSTWATNNSAWSIRLLAFTIAPLLVVGGLYARARSVLPRDPTDCFFLKKHSQAFQNEVLVTM